MHPEMIERMMRTLDQETSEASPDEVRGLQTHLMQCADCAGQWAALLAVHQQMSNAAALAPASGFAPRVMQRIAAREQKRARYRIIFGVTAFVLGSLGVFALALYLSPLGELFASDGWTAVVNNVIAWLAFFSALTRVADSFGASLLEHVNGNILVLAAFVTFGLTLVWARLVTGTPVLNRRSL